LEGGIICQNAAVVNEKCVGHYPSDPELHAGDAA
jgi:hypothetical protein